MFADLLSILLFLVVANNGSFGDYDDAELARIMATDPQGKSCPFSVYMYFKQF